MRKKISLVFAVPVLAALTALPAARAADHGDSPQVRDDTRLDINDVYVFKSPANADNTVIAMTVCPLAGVTGPKSFSNVGAKYQFAIDTNGDAIEDQIYSFQFTPVDRQ